MDAMTLHPATAPAATHRARAALVWLTAVGLGVGFFCVEHNVAISTLDTYGTTSEDLQERAESGKLIHQLGFILIAGVGVLGGLYGGGRPLCLRGALPLLMAFLVCWCLLSTLWADDPFRTARKSAAVALCYVGVLGVARHWTDKELGLVTLAITATSAVLGLVVELGLGTFQPHDPDYRFAGTLHPNEQGATCAVLCLCACSLWPAARRYRALLAVMLAGGLACLVLSKSRLSLFGMVAALVLLSLLKLSTRRISLVLGALWVVLGVVLAALLAGVDLDQQWNLLFLGRAEYLGTLTGRTELWEELLPHVGRRLIVGYGYGCFWTPARIEEVSSTLYWGMTSAHSAYLETLLNIGLVGMGAFLVVLVLATRAAVRHFRLANEPCAGLVFLLLTFHLICGLAETIVPTLVSFVTVVGLTRLAYYPGGVSEEQARHGCH
jgi:O-antigen ligase